MPARRRASFGSIFRKPRPGGGHYPGYYVRWVEAGRRIQRGAFMTRDAAETFLAARRRERSERRALGLKEIRLVRLSDVLPEYAAWCQQSLRPTTVAGRRSVIRRFGAEFGSRVVSSITADEILRFMDRARADLGWAPSTMGSCLTMIGGLFAWCVSRGYVQQTPTTGLHARLPRAARPEPPYLEPSELRRIYAACPRRIRTIVMLWGEAGLRRDEAIYLEHGEVSSDRGRITLRAARTKAQKGRTIPLTDTARQALTKSLADSPVPVDQSARVFGVERGFVQHRFAAAMRRIGRPEITPRTLRHAFASGLVRAGVDVATVMRLMGHSSLAVTQIYAVHAPRDAAAQAIDALQRSRRPPAELDGSGSASGV